MSFDKMPTSPGRRERSIDINKITRGLQLVLLRTHSEIFNPKNGLHLLFIEKRKPQNNSRSGPESVLTRLSVNCLVDCSMLSVIVNLLEMSGRLTS